MKPFKQYLVSKFENSWNHENEINITSKAGTFGEGFRIEQMNLVYFIQRRESKSILTMYSYLLQSSTDNEKDINELRIKYPAGCKKIVDRTADFFKEEVVNSVFLKSKKYTVIKDSDRLHDNISKLDLTKLPEQLKSDDLKKELTKWYEKTKNTSATTRKPSIAIAESIDGGINKLILSGESEHVAEESIVNLTHSLGKHQFPKSLHPIHPYVCYWTKAEWIYDEPYSEEISFDCQLIFENKIPINALSIYVVCADGYEIENTTNRLVKDTVNEESESNDFTFVQRYDHRTKEREYFREWEDLNIRTSNMFRCYFGKEAKESLKTGVKKIEIAIRLNDERSRIRKELYLVVFTVILGLIAEFIQDTNPLKYYYLKGMPQSFTNCLLFAMVFISSLQVIKKNNLGIKWLNIVNNIIVSIFGAISIFYIIVQEIPLFNLVNWINDGVIVLIGMYIVVVTIIIAFRKLFRDRITRFIHKKYILPLSKITQGV